MKKITKLLSACAIVVACMVFSSCASTKTEKKISDSESYLTQNNYKEGIYKSDYMLLKTVDVTDSLNEKTSPFYRAEIGYLFGQQLFFGADAVGMYFFNFTTGEDYINMSKAGKKIKVDDFFQYTGENGTKMGMGFEKTVKIGNFKVSFAFASLNCIEDGLRIWYKVLN
ncbi:MAG: hypothetical protein HUK25_03490 [Treponema sp.]|nr:hypothetical protein [Treponema sp.]